MHNYENLLQCYSEQLCSFKFIAYLLWLRDLSRLFSISIQGPPYITLNKNWRYIQWYILKCLDTGKYGALLLFSQEIWGLIIRAKFIAAKVHRNEFAAMKFRSYALSHLWTFAPMNFRSYALSLQCTYTHMNFRSSDLASFKLI